VKPDECFFCIVFLLMKQQEPNDAILS